MSELKVNKQCLFDTPQSSKFNTEMNGQTYRQTDTTWNSIPQQTQGQEGGWGVGYKYENPLRNQVYRERVKKSKPIKDWINSPTLYYRN